MKMNLHHTHKTRFWYPLQILFKISDNHPSLFYMESLPGFQSQHNPIYLWLFLLCYPSWTKMVSETMKCPILLCRVWWDMKRLSGRPFHFQLLQCMTVLFFSRELAVVRINRDNSIAMKDQLWYVPVIRLIFFMDVSFCKIHYRFSA